MNTVTTTLEPPAGGTTAHGRDGLNYGALGLPLAFVALPLYVVLPQHYASAFGVPLALLGFLLLGTRLLDAVADPWIGRWADGWLAHSAGRAWLALALAAGALAVGFRGLFFPPPSLAPPALLVWCGVWLTITYLSYSVVGVIHQAWGARLGGDEPVRARIVAWREGLALLGVLVASVLPSVLGLSATSGVFALLLALGVWMLRAAPQARPSPHQAPVRVPVPMRLPFASPAFRRLLWVYLVNGTASAVPATLVLFFIRDRLQAPTYEPLFLASYFAAGALSMPLWVRLVGRFGLAQAWLAGMGLSVAVFVWAATLSAGDVAGFTAVCVLSGVALGADLSVPPALLAGVIQRAGHGGRAEGAYFGWWNLATKLNLALAAGLALPLLQAIGYAPGSQNAQALSALTVAYCLLPCVLKLIAAGLLWALWLRAPLMTKAP